MKYMGIDLHKQYFVTTVMDKDWLDLSSSHHNPGCSVILHPPE